MPLEPLRCSYHALYMCVCARCPSGTTDGEHRGIIPRAACEVFDYIQEDAHDDQRSSQWLVRCSFCQIYNEKISDLLSSDPKSNDLKIRESGGGGTFIDKLSETVVRTPSDVYNLLRLGSAQRNTNKTTMNATSSRSHAVFTIIVEHSQGQADSPDHSDVTVGRLNLVDLAGSERFDVTSGETKHQKETVNINTSLSAFGKVVLALTSKGVAHIPYRDSKLTRILQDSLGGNSKTTMIGAISPMSMAFQESVSTLKFCNRAKSVKNVAQINQDLSESAMLTAMQSEIKRLQQELASKHNGEDSRVELEKFAELMEASEKSKEEKKVIQDELVHRKKQVAAAQREKDEYMQKINELENKLVAGGTAVEETAEFKAAVAKERKRLQEEAHVKEDEMEKERLRLEQEKAQFEQERQIFRRRSVEMIKDAELKTAEAQEQAEVAIAKAKVEEERARSIEASAKAKADEQDERQKASEAKMEERRNLQQAAMSNSGPPSPRSRTGLRPPGPNHPGGFANRMTHPRNGGHQRPTNPNQRPISGRPRPPPNGPRGPPQRGGHSPRAFQRRTSFERQDQGHSPRPGRPQLVRSYSNHSDHSEGQPQSRPQSGQQRPHSGHPSSRHHAHAHSHTHAYTPDPGDDSSDSDSETTYSGHADQGGGNTWASPTSESYSPLGRRRNPEDDQPHPGDRVADARDPGNEQNAALEQYASALQHPRTGIPLSSRRSRLTTYKMCFSGADAAGWFMANLEGTHSKEHAQAVGQQLLDLGVIRHVKRGKQFMVSDTELFQFRSSQQEQEQGSLFQSRRLSRSSSQASIGSIGSMTSVNTAVSGVSGASRNSLSRSKSWAGSRTSLTSMRSSVSSASSADGSGSYDGGEHFVGDDDGLKSPLHLAAGRGDVSGIRQLVQDYGVENLDSSGRTPLMYAVIGNKAKACKALVKANANINARDDIGNTSLIWAACRGAANSLKELLKMGADVAATDNEGRTCMHWATKLKRTDCLDLILRCAYRVVVNKKDDEQLTALHWATMCDHGNHVAVLLKAQVRKPHMITPRLRDFMIPTTVICVLHPSSTCEVLLGAKHVSNPESGSLTPFDVWLIFVRRKFNPIYYIILFIIFVRRTLR